MLIANKPTKEDLKPNLDFDCVNINKQSLNPKEYIQRVWTDKIISAAKGRWNQKDILCIFEDLNWDESKINLLYERTLTKTI